MIFHSITKIVPHSHAGKNLDYLSFSSQCETSIMRVSLEGPHKKPIIMCIHENNVYSLPTMDQDADSVWVMTLNCLGHNNVYSR